MYKEYDKTAVEMIKKQREAAFRQGVMNERIPPSMIEALKKHENNVEGLETTLAVFADFPPKRCMMLRIKHRLEQEKKWKLHYEKCIEEHKKGRDRLTTLMKGMDLKIVVDMIITEDKEERKNPKKKHKEDEAAFREDKAPMIAKVVDNTVPEENDWRKLRGAARRRAFEARRNR